MQSPTETLKILSHMKFYYCIQFYIFSTVFKSYQDYGQMIMEGCVQWNPFTFEKISLQAGLKPRTTRSVGQGLTH